MKTEAQSSSFRLFKKNIDVGNYLLLITICNLVKKASFATYCKKCALNLNPQINVPDKYVSM